MYNYDFCRIHHCGRLITILLLVSISVNVSYIPVTSAPRYNVFDDALGVVKDIGGGVVDLAEGTADTVGSLGMKILGVDHIIQEVSDAVQAGIDSLSGVVTEAGNQGVRIVTEGGNQGVRIVQETGNQGERVIRVTGEETRQTLDKFHETLDRFHQNNLDMINFMSQTYKDDLAITIDSLDDGSRRILRNFEQSLESINNLITKDIIQVEESAINVINAASIEVERNIGTLKKSIEDVIIVAGETYVLMLDKTTNNMISIISIAMLGLGLLLFVYLFFTRRLPKGLSATFVYGFMAVFLLGFGILLLSPSVKAYAMASTQLGVRAELKKSAIPEVSFIAPGVVEKSDNLKTFTVIGINLTKKKLLGVMVNNQPANIGGNSTDYRIIVTIEGNTLKEGNSNAVDVVLNYEDSLRFSLPVSLITATPEPTITSTYVPATPIPPTQDLIWTLRFRGLDQDDERTQDIYVLKVNDSKPITFDEKTPATSEGDLVKDWENYDFPLKVKSGQENIISISVTSEGRTQLIFDFIQLESGDKIIWSFGKGDYLYSDLFDEKKYPTGEGVNSTPVERTVDIYVDEFVTEQNAKIFPDGIYGPGYSHLPSTVRVHFSVSGNQ